MILKVLKEEAATDTRGGGRRGNNRSLEIATERSAEVKSSGSVCRENEKERRGRGGGAT